jgi:hypothetical protein
MDHQKKRGVRGRDSQPCKRRTQAQIHRDEARNQELANQAREKNKNALARYGFISQLQGEGESIAGDEPMDDLTPAALVQGPTRMEYDDIEIYDDFDGDDGDDNDTADVGNDDGVESYCPIETLMGGYITALEKDVKRH